MSFSKPNNVGALLLEVGALLMSAGANTNRIRLTIKRIAKGYGYQVEFLITHRAIMLTLENQDGELTFNHVKQTYSQIPNFKMVSGISRLSWRIIEENLSFQTAWTELERLKSLSTYPRFLVLATVAMACSAFCRISGGSFMDMGFVLVASFAGLFVRQELAKRGVNPYFNIFLSAWITTMICSGLQILGGFDPNNSTLVTAVLYLIPGIPLINSISDILDGNSLNGMVRALNGMVISFAIASGLLIALLIFNLQ